MENLQTLTENYLEYCRTQKCLDEKTLKAYRIDLRQFSEEPYLVKITEITPTIWRIILPGSTNNINPKP